MKRTRQHLIQLQSLPLEQKVILTRARLRDWYTYCKGNVYVSFSGGKDSTVLLDIARQMYPHIPAVFVDTGLEYPEIRDFVRTFDNVIWLKPSKQFRQILMTEGYPVVSKEVSQAIREGRKYDGVKYSYRMKQLEGDSKHLNMRRWKYLLSAPFGVSERCCDYMKKKPARKYERESGNSPITATMAEESFMRQSAWMTHGCNSYNSSRKISSPMSFWTEQDVLKYIHDKNLPIASVYGEVVKVVDQGDLFGENYIQYKTTGLRRTGCMFCMFGVHLERYPNRFQLMQNTHPKQYEYCMKPLDKGGLGLKDVLEYMGVNA